MSGEGFQWARRLFLSRLGAGAAAFGLLPQRPSETVRSNTWQPARHAEDDWFDQVPGKHRFFFDTTTPAALGGAIFFGNNYFGANRTGYGLEDSDLAVIICVRHRSTPFAFDNEIWAKYGGPIAERSGFTDPNTSQAPSTNVYRSTTYGASLPNNGITLDVMIKRGVRLAVCQTSTRAYATTIAAKTSGNADAVYKEITEHLIPNSHLVPAGIVAVNRAQEHGYSFAYVG